MTLDEYYDELEEKKEIDERIGEIRKLLDDYMEGLMVEVMKQIEVIMQKHV